MTEEKDLKTYAEQSRFFIELVGSRNLQEICRCSRQNLTRWRKHGIPFSWRLFFEKQYPAEYKKAFTNLTL